MKYKVIQKIKAFGLQVGDVFKSNGDGTFSREYRRIEGNVCVPEIILSTHPEWFFKQVSNYSSSQLNEAIKEVKKTYTSQSSRKALKKLSEILEKNYE